MRMIITQQQKATFIGVSFKKNLANITTVSRVVLSLVLLTFKSFSFWFYLIFFFCGLTDISDGFIARKLKIESDFGKRIDTIADLIFFAVSFYKIASQVSLPIWVIIWVIIIALIKIVVLLKLKELPHTSLNKLAGFGIFVTVFLLSVINENICFAIMCVLGSLSAISETFFAFKKQTQKSA